MAAYQTLYERLSQLEDSRDPEHITFSLPEILFIIYASILSDYTKWSDMEIFAKNNQEWFRRFFPYQFGFPAHDTIRKVCARVNPVDFMQLFADWMSESVEQIHQHRMGPPQQKSGSVIALDGKALRGSRPAKGKKMVHIVSAYSSELKLTLGFSAVDQKSNEITAIPKVLEMFSLEGTLVSVDAMGCQRDICQSLIDKKADYLLCVKKNQPTLHNRIQSIFSEHIQQTPTDTADGYCFAETVEKKSQSF